MSKYRDAVYSNKASIRILLIACVLGAGQLSAPIVRGGERCQDKETAVILPVDQSTISHATRPLPRFASCIR